MGKKRQHYRGSRRHGIERGEPEPSGHGSQSQGLVAIYHDAGSSGRRGGKGTADPAFPRPCAARPESFAAFLERIAHLLTEAFFQQAVVQAEERAGNSGGHDIEQRRFAQRRGGNPQAGKPLAISLFFRIHDDDAAIVKVPDMLVHRTGIESDQDVRTLARSMDGRGGCPDGKGVVPSPYP